MRHRSFEELDRQPTHLGDLVLRRRLDPSLHVDVYEVKLGDEYLMSSLFTVAETALAHLTLAQLTGPDLDVVVGGLGLGYTANAVLEDQRVRSLAVVEAYGAVIAWHTQGLVPHGRTLAVDARCQLVEDDFFAVMRDSRQRWHAVLLDIDHSPRHLLDPSHAAFYKPDGLRRVAEHLHPGGAFGMWSDGAPDAEFVADLETAFATVTAHTVTFPNPITDGESSSTVYVAATG